MSNPNNSAEQFKVEGLRMHHGFDGRRNELLAYPARGTRLHEQAGGNPVGMATYEELDPSDEPWGHKGPRGVSIHHIEIAPQLKGQGVGKEIVKSVLEANPGRKLYTTLTTPEGSRLFSSREVRMAAARNFGRRLP